MAVAAPVDALLALALGTDGDEHVRPWTNGSVFLIYDDDPVIRIGHSCREHPRLDSKAIDDKFGKMKFDNIRDNNIPESLGVLASKWSTLNLGAALSADRRFAMLRLKFTVPKGIELLLVVVPRKLLLAGDVLAMVTDIAEEFGWFSAADAKRNGRWTGLDRFFGPGIVTTDGDLIQRIEEELVAARALRRYPYSAAEPLQRFDDPVPIEDALVTRWAQTRCRQLRQLLPGLDAARERAEQCLKGTIPDKRRTSLEGAKNDHEQLRAKILRLQQDLRSLQDQREFSTPLSLGPAMQRDWRLRRLLRAFAKPHVELPRLAWANPTSEPPSLNQLFELWCATMIVRKLRELGFVGSLTAPWVGATATGCSWELVRTGLRVRVDFEVDSKLADLEQLRVRTERSVTVLQAAVDQVCAEVDDARYVALSNECSPDYILRIDERGSPFLLIGDATLADLPYLLKKGAQRKDDKVEDYLRNIAAVGESGSVVRGHQLGGFVLVPGAQEDWSTFAKPASDVAVIALHPDTNKGRAGAGLLEAFLAEHVGRPVTTIQEVA